MQFVRGGLFSGWCPGCDTFHQVPVNPVNPKGWTFTGTPEKPTLAPSLLVSWDDYTDSPDTPVKRVCHSFVREGRWEFLSDCTHSLAGQTVDLPEKVPAEWD